MDKIRIPATEAYLLALIIIVLLIVERLFSLDFYFADLIYNRTHSWEYKNAWVTNQLMHSFGKYSLILLYLVFVIRFFLRDKSSETAYQRYGKIVFLFSVLVGTLCVSILKKTLNVDCPWDLLRYGGEKEYYSLFNYAKESLPSNHCFPSGHASSAFTWISLYFYSSIYYPHYKYKVLFSVIALGFVFGFGQQLRGAHFISHDLWSLLVCLSVNGLIYKLAFSIPIKPHLQ